MKNKFYHISTYSVMRYWTILWMAILSFSCSDFNPMDSYSRIPPDRNTDIDDGDEGDGAGGLLKRLWNSEQALSRYGCDTDSEYE